jgi:transcriptional regulator with XRE-family HTH domain
VPRPVRQKPKNEALKRLGLRIQALRKGELPHVRSSRTMIMSQEDLADAAGIARSYMSGIERGVRNPSVMHIIRIAKALDVAVGDLFPH